MKALTIRQPWASAIILLGKDAENRSQRFRHRGPLLIHAAGTCTRDEYEVAWHFIVETVKPPKATLDKLPWFTALPLGCFVGIAHVVDCVDDSESPWFVGPHALILESTRALPHVACKGKLGLWDAPLDLLRKLGLSA